MELGAHAGFILASYAAAALVVTGLIGWVLADHRILQRMLQELGARQSRGQRPPSAAGDPP